MLGKQYEKPRSAPMVAPGKDNGPPGPGMVFIVSSNTRKVNPATRKLIRSYVMQGKKQKRGHHSGYQGTPRHCDRHCCTQATQISLDEAIETHAALLPGRVGSDLSFIDFVDEVEPSMALNMIKCEEVGTLICID